MSSKSLKGFTLVEQISVLALTTFLVLIGFTGIMNLNRLMIKVQDQSAKDRMIYLLHNIMEEDFRSAIEILLDEDLIIKPSEVSYSFKDDMILRKTKVVDTFNVAVKGIKYEITDGLIEEVSFTVETIQSYKMRFNKQYPEYQRWERCDDVKMK